MTTNTTPRGWECPKCGRVYSPTQQMCLHCPEKYSGSLGVTTSSTVQTVHSCYSFTPDVVGQCKICGRTQFQHPIISTTQ